MLLTSGWVGLSQAVLAAQAVSLTEVVRRTMALYFADPAASAQSVKQLVREVSPAQPDRHPAGVFVTLSRNGQTRACWGSVYPQHKNVVESAVYATLGALSKEYRYRPISRTEWTSLKPQVTVIRELQPMESIRGLNPLRDGVMVRSGSKSGVMLPGEARDAHYLLVQGKLKAGIGPREKFQLYRIIADVYR